MSKRKTLGVTILVSSIIPSFAFSQSSPPNPPILPTSSTSPSIVPTVSPNAILTVDSGFIQSPGSSITTNVQCPMNFKPYVTISTNTITNSTNTLLNSFKACVSGQPASSGSGYNVPILTTQTIYTYQDTTISGGYYSSVSWYFNGESMPQTSWIAPSSNISTGVGGLSWVLYCYPPNISVPVITCP